MQLISEVKQWYKLWSIQISFLGAFWTMYSDQIATWWNIHATEYFPFMSLLMVKWIGLIITVTGIYLRLIKQEKLSANRQ